MTKKRRNNKMAQTFITIVKCWNDPRATKDPHYRTKLLSDYLYTTQRAARHDLMEAKKKYPTFGWSIDFRVAGDGSQIAF